MPILVGLKTRATSLRLSRSGRGGRPSDSRCQGESSQLTSPDRGAILPVQGKAHGLNSYGRNSYGLNSYGLNGYGLDRYGLNSYGRNSYGLESYGPQSSGSIQIRPVSQWRGSIRQSLRVPNMRRFLRLLTQTLAHVQARTCVQTQAGTRARTQAGS